MTSINAVAVAKEVKDTVRKGTKVVMGKIIKKHGYAPSVVIKPDKVTRTKSYQEEIAPFIESLEKERIAALARAEEKRNTAQYHQLIEAVDKLTKNIQLLRGGSTENVSLIQFKWKGARQRQLN